MAQAAASQRTMSAVAIIEEKPKLKRIYVNINGWLEIVWGLKKTETHVVIKVWGDDINNLQSIELPLDAELIVL